MSIQASINSIISSGVQGAVAGSLVSQNRAQKEEARQTEKYNQMGMEVLSEVESELSGPQLALLRSKADIANERVRAYQQMAKEQAIQTDKLEASLRKQGKISEAERVSQIGHSRKEANKEFLRNQLKDLAKEGD